MSDLWDDYERYVRQWRAEGDSERLAMAELAVEGYRYQESDPGASIAVYDRGRQEAIRLQEPWWVLAFEGWRLNAATSFAMDFARAMPLAVELMARVNGPAALGHSHRADILTNALYTYTNVDPIGHREDIERGFAYLEDLVPDGPVSARFVLNHRRIAFLAGSERWEEARDFALIALALTDRARESYMRCWHGSWALLELCGIAAAMGDIEAVGAHAEHMETLARNASGLRRAESAAWCWLAVAMRAAGDARGAGRCYHKGLRMLQELHRRHTNAADAVARYFELGGDLRAAIGVRDREIAELAQNGRFHRQCLMHIERCRLLARLGELTPPDLDAVRDLARRQRVPGWYLHKLDAIRPSGPSVG